MACLSLSLSLSLPLSLSLSLPLSLPLSLSPSPSLSLSPSSSSPPKGEVEQIALMKPRAQTEHDEGMLEFLEDIIGTSRLKEPIEEMNKRVDELNEGRGEKV